MASVPFPDSSPPPLPQLLREAGSAVALRWRRSTLRRPADRARSGEPVLVIPGFLASDNSTLILRSAIEDAGFRPYGWRLGMNLGARPDLFERLDARFEKVARRGPVTLVGWSLGGLYARELAKRHPGQVRQVITLGSPFSGDVRANHAWRLYEMMNGHPVDSPPIDVRLTEKPPVPTIAFWSRQDGIVAPASARGTPEESDESIELDCTHMGFMSARCAIDAVIGRLKA